MQLKVLVIGAGAIGAYYGGRLAQAGARVSVLARSDFDTVKKQGYAVTSVDGDFHFQPEAVYAFPAQAGNDYDLILVGLKVLPEIDTVHLLQPLVRPGSAILLLQNGINIEQEIVQAFPEQEILSGLAFVCVTRTSPGKIYHQDYGHLAIGNYLAHPTALTRGLSELWESAGVKCRVEEDTQAARWKKLCWNAPYNPLSVIGGGINTAQIMGYAPMAALVKEIMEEVRALSIADGHGFDPEYIEGQLQTTLKMTPYKPSMLLDYEARRPMEVEAILGNALKVADRLGVPVPHLRTVYAILSLMDKNNLTSRERPV